MGNFKKFYAICLIFCSNAYANESDFYSTIIPAAATWNYVLAETPKLESTTIAQVYDIDLFAASVNDIANLHSTGAKVVCYISAGTSESWRPDSGRFPRLVLGKNVGDEKGERWLDVRQIALLLPIIEARVAICQSKGFDAVEFDHVDGYRNKTGFNIRDQDQIQYNKALAALAHKHNLAVGLKNDLNQIPDLVDSFDFAINEQCYKYNECQALAPFYQNSKAVLNVEYNQKEINCSNAKENNISSTYKTVDLKESPFDPC